MNRPPLRSVLWALWLGVAIGLLAANPAAAQPPATKPAPAKQAAAKPAAAKPQTAKAGKDAKDSEVEQAVKRFESDSRDIFQKRNEIVDVCQLKAGMQVADVGAGSGLFSRLFAKKVAPGGKVYAVDISKKYVEYIEETCRKQKIANVTGVLCTADSTGLAPACVDLVFVCDTYHHFAHPQKSLASIHQALRPGGRLVHIDFRKEKGVSPDWMIKHVRADRAMLIKEVTQAGFKLLDEPQLMKLQQVYRFGKK